jgi:hypothetical protein
LSTSYLYFKEFITSVQLQKNRTGGVVITTLAFQAGKPGFNHWYDRTSTKGLKIIEEKELYLYIDISKWLDFRVFSDKDVKL